MKDSSAQSAEFESLKKRTDAHRRGYDFQPFVGNLFRAQHFKVEEKAGISAPRQVDLLATRGEEVYLIETKWQQDPADIDDVDALFTRLEPVPPGEDPQFKWTPDRLTCGSAERMSTNGSHETEVHAGVQDRGRSPGHRHRQDGHRGGW
jgi:hypothetical protein